jgi:hypothetical protein
MVTEIPESLM